MPEILGFMANHPVQTFILFLLLISLTGVVFSGISEVIWAIHGHDKDSKDE